MIACLQYGAAAPEFSPNLTPAPQWIPFGCRARVMVRSCVVVWLALAMPTDTWAALGQAPFAHIQTLAMPATPKPRLLASGALRQAVYTVHELQLETGTVVREFADTSGQVFAVTWRGPVLPDLSQWLGGYFGTFQQETDQQRRAGRRGAPVNLVQEGLVVRSNGRMRHFFGHAYLPARVPPTVDVNEVLQDGLQ